MANKLNSNERDDDVHTLELVQLSWIKAAKYHGVAVREWVINTLNSAAEKTPLDYHLLDDLNYKNQSNTKTPFYFQTVALRHWVGLTQSDAAKAINLPSSAYRNCESEDDKVLMEVDVWNEYVRRITILVGKQDADSLPNSFCRGIRGLAGLNYRELNDISSLSQSYWTTRLRFKQPPIPIELSSVKELLKILIKKIDAKFKKGKMLEGRAMLKSILFLAYYTQLIRVEKTPGLESVMHIMKHPKSDSSESVTDVLIDELESDGVRQVTQKSSPVNRANLFAITIASLEKRGYHFSEGHPDIQFIEVN